MWRPRRFGNTGETKNSAAIAARIPGRYDLNERKGRERNPDPVKVAAEAALWGAECDQGLLRDTVVVSDGAGRFWAAEHALCSVHADRLVNKLQLTCAAHRRALDLKRSLIWWFYSDLKVYQREPDTKRARKLRTRFDWIFTSKKGYVLLDRQMARLHRLTSDLQRVLDHFEIPLHTNGFKNTIRAVVTKRKISGGTVSAVGITARDAVLALFKTCSQTRRLVLPLPR